MNGEQSGGLPAAGSGQSQNASSTPAGQAGAGEQQQGATPQFLTREDALELFRSEFGKQGQSISDKTAARVQKMIDAAAKKGVTLTPEQAQAALEAAEPEQPQQSSQQATPPTATPSGPAAGQQPGKPASQAQAPAPANDPVTVQGEEILRKEFNLDPEQVAQTDPEYQLLDLKTRDPEKYLASVRAYGKAKQERLATEGDASRLPGLASAGRAANVPAHAGKSGTQTLDDYYRSKFGN